GPAAPSRCPESAGDLSIRTLTRGPRRLRVEPACRPSCCLEGGLRYSLLAVYQRLKLCACLSGKRASACGASRLFSSVVKCRCRLRQERYKKRNGRFEWN